VTYRRLIALTVAIVALLAVTGTAMPVGDLAGDHGDSHGDEEIIEVQTISRDAAPDGKLEVEISYHIGDEVGEMQPIFLEPDTQVVELDGFQQEDDTTFAWDQSTSQPSITVHIPENRSVAAIPGYEYAATDDWWLSGWVRTNIQWTAVNPDRIDRTVYVQSDAENSISGRTMVYVGDHETESFQSSREEFTLVDTAFAHPEQTNDDIQSALINASDMFDGGGDGEPVTLFVVSDPIRRGGLTSGDSSDFWIHEESLKPGKTTLLHEYVHSRQTDRRDDAVQWTYEGEPQFYEYLLGLKQGAIDYHDFHESLGGADETYSDVVLSNPDSWEGTDANYDLGALTIAVLDKKIREASGRTSSYEDVFRAKNADDADSISNDAFESMIADAAGSSLDSFLDDAVQSQPPSLAVPSPRTYDTPKDGADLSVAIEKTSVAPGDSSALQFEVTNTGDQVSIAPTLSVDLPAELTAGKTEIRDQGVDSEKTIVDDQIVFDNLQPGETLVFDYTVTAAEDAQLQEYTAESTVTDMGGVTSSHFSDVDVTVTPDAALSAPEGVPVTDSVSFDASESSDAEGITEYRWELFGPTDSSTATNSPTYKHTFDEPGEYTVVLTVENERGATDSVERSIIVSDQPSISIDAPDQVTPGGTAIFESIVTNEIGEYEVRWQFDDKEIVADVLRYTFNNTGERELTAIVEDEYGATGSETITINVGGGGDVNGESDSGPLDAVGPGLGVGTAVVALVTGMTLFLARDRYTR
jgi:PKD repeat protein